MKMLIMVIVFITSNITFILFALSVIFALISIKLKNKYSDKAAVMDIIISWYLFFYIGVHHLFSAVMLIFFGHTAAEFAGWPFSPFANEVGFANLSYAIMGFIAFKASRPFQSAVLMIVAFFLLGAFCGHLYQIIVAHNFTSGNFGLYFWCDLIFPFINFIFIYLRYKFESDKNKNLTGKDRLFSER